MGGVFFVEVVEPVFDGASHRDGLLYVLVSGLEDGDAAVDDGALFEPCPLLARGVFRQDGCGAFVDESASVDGSESEIAECAGEGLDRRIGVECYFSHNERGFRFV